MNFFDITSYVKPERVLDFNFSTQMLFRCIERKYAQTFIKGEIRFSKPMSWIKEEDKGNKGKGDKLEGTFLSVEKNDKSEFINSLKQSKDIKNFDYEGFTFFRKNAIEELYCLCFYGLNDNSYNEKRIDNKGIAHYTSRVEKEFFESFSERISKVEYLKKDEKDRPAVIFINNPHEFFKRIKKFFMKFGINEREIIISPVQYINKKKNSISAISYPKELLLKDKYYEKQCEVRIIINSTNTNFLEYMKKHNSIINIGSIEDICQIYDYYFDDLIIEKKGKNTIEFNLPHEEVEKYENMSLERVLTILAQAYQNRLPDSAQKQREYIINKMEFILKNRFKVDVVYENGRINILNASDEIIEYLKEYSKPYMKIQDFERNINLLIENKEYEKAYKKIESTKDLKLKQLGEFYKGKILENQNNYVRAIKKYNYCIDNEINLEKSLEYRSDCYYKIGKYNLALNDLNLLQELIGYNSQIYSKKGVNLLNINKLTEALEEFNKSINLKKDNAEAYYNRSVAYYRLQDYKRAKDDIKKALSYNPMNNFYQTQYEKFYKNL